LKKTIITTSWDDGHPLDLRLAGLLKKYDVPATFYLPIDNAERECLPPQGIREISEVFDVGGHTYHHLDLTRVPHKEAGMEITNGKRRLEEIIGRELLSFCYPFGSFNGRVAGMVREAGFIGARTAKSITRNVKDPFKMGITVTATNWGSAPYIKHSIESLDSALFLFMLKNNLFFKRWDRIAMGTLDFVVANGGIWHLCGHSWEIDKNDDWARLEEVFRRISGLPPETLKLNNSQLLKLRPEKS